MRCPTTPRSLAAPPGGSHRLPRAHAGSRGVVSQTASAPQGGTHASTAMGDVQRLQDALEEKSREHAVAVQARDKANSVNEQLKMKLRQLNVENQRLKKQKNGGGGGTKQQQCQLQDMHRELQQSKQALVKEVQQRSEMIQAAEQRHNVQLREAKHQIMELRQAMQMQERQLQAMVESGGASTLLPYQVSLGMRVKRADQTQLTGKVVGTVRKNTRLRVDFSAAGGPLLLHLRAVYQHIM